MTQRVTRSDRGRRADYVPFLRPRIMRDEGQRRFTPGYLDDISDTKFQFVSDGSGSTARKTAVTPTTRKRIRLVRLSIHQIAADGLHFAEVYFGTGANIAINKAKAIDYVRVPDLSEGTSRTWIRGAGPVGLKNEVLSYRFTVSPTTSHKLIVEYTEER